MRNRILIVTVVAAALALGACGSDGSSASSSSTTTPGVSLGRAVCTAYLRATKGEDRPSAQARNALTELAKVDADPADREKLRAVAAAFREVERVWTGTATTTPDAFDQAAQRASESYAEAADVAGVNPCPAPDEPDTSSTTGADATEPTWSFNTVDVPTSGGGLWVYFDATCPSGTKVTGVTAPWVANPGAPDVSFAALVQGLPEGAPFTATAADEAFAAKPDFVGSCA